MSAFLILGGFFALCCICLGVVAYIAERAIAERERPSHLGQRRLP